MARATTIRFSDPIYARLERASKYTGLPINAIVTAACMEWLRDQFPASIDVHAPAQLAERPALEYAADLRVAGRELQLSADARDAMRSAEEEARRFRHGYVGTEHLLAGLAADITATGGQALGQVGIDAGRVREAITFIVGRGVASKPETPGLTPRAANVLRRAADEARRRGHAEVDSGYLLLGLCGETEGLAVRIIESLGAGVDDVTAAVEALLG